MFWRKSSDTPTSSPSNDTVEVSWSLKGSSSVNTDSFSVPSGTEITKSDAAYTVARTKGLIWSDERGEDVVTIRSVKKK